MGALEGRVAIITGAGRGLGREHALLFAREGARVIVNDLDVTMDGGATNSSGDDRGAAQQVVDEIVATGGQAVANTDDIADWEGGRRLLNTALDAFGELHVLVNNAGILRDRMLVNMTEDEWDSVIRAHLKGHLVPIRWAADHWRQRSKAGHQVQAAVVNSSSTSGLLGNAGQANYGAAKAGIAALTIIAAQELEHYGVRVNAVVPAARTRMTEATPGLSEMVQPPQEPDVFDQWDPANTSPVVAYLSGTSCRTTGKVFFVQGGRIQVFRPWALVEADDKLDNNHRWTVAELEAEMARLGA
ncbi:MAG: short-chain dehydrogenase [Acidimicrobiales bacterium]|nr:MAG: short-chain dehydrogenase [Acidimicrobiales bacterium]